MRSDTRIGICIYLYLYTRIGLFLLVDNSLLADGTKENVVCAHSESKTVVNYQF